MKDDLARSNCHENDGVGLGFTVCCCYSHPFSPTFLLLPLSLSTLLSRGGHLAMDSM